MKMINILPGTSMQSFKIDTVMSMTVECIETFNITIMSVSTCGVAIGSDNTSTVMIKDNGSK